MPADSVRRPAGQLTDPAYVKCQRLQTEANELEKYLQQQPDAMSAFGAPRRPMTHGFDVWPPPGPRTYSAYDCEEGRPCHNLRSVKWGLKGGVWKMEFVNVVGPPMEERRRGIGCCWLCNAMLNVHERKWTRPEWTRVVSWSKRVPQLPYERARPASRTIAPESKTWRGPYTPAQNQSRQVNSI